MALSSELYHHYRPDVIVGLITTQPPAELAPTDCELRDWRQAGLHQPSFFRLFTVTLPQRDIRLIGRLSEADWALVRACFKAGFGAKECIRIISARAATRRERTHDLSKLKGGVRGKYYKQAIAETNLVLIDPELAAFFPDSRSVNRALRLLADTARAAVPPRIPRR